MEPMQKKKRANALLGFSALSAQPGSTENGLSYSVRIDATFGSEFQRTVGIKNLKGLLATWKVVVEAQHKKNAITVIRSRD
jgi:hypothetical protein